MSLEKCLKKMLGLLDEKFSLLNNMYIITLAQTKAIDNENLGELKMLICDKQVNINSIDILNKQINTIFMDLKDQLNKEEIFKIKGFNEIILKITEIIKKIDALDKKNVKIILSMIKNNKEDSKNLALNKHALLAYISCPQNLLPYYIDRRK